MISQHSKTGHVKRAGKEARLQPATLRVRLHLAHGDVGRSSLFKPDPSEFRIRDGLHAGVAISIHDAEGPASDCASQEHSITLTRRQAGELVAGLQNAITAIERAEQSAAA